MAMVSEDFYHGWVIQVEREPVGYTFQCWMSEQQVDVGLTDAQYYSTFDQALSAGRLRADLESVRLSLTNFLRGKLKHLLLYPDEQNSLENSIAQYIDLAKNQFG